MKGWVDMPTNDQTDEKKTTTSDDDQQKAKPERKEQGRTFGRKGAERQK